MEGLCRTIRDAPPTHFRLKIEGFSSLSSSLERYESCEFDAGGYKWKLAFYPNGNKKKDGEEDHISLYLVLNETSVNLKKDILVRYSLLAYDHSRDKYMEVQELSRFHELKSESGFDKFLFHKNFNDPSNGYLMNDTCVFGAEVFVINPTTKGQCLSMTAQDTIPKKYTWNLNKFSKLQAEYFYSGTFRVGGGLDMKMKCFPKGDKTNKANNSSLSLYLYLDASKSLLPAGMDVFVEFKLRLVNQVNENHKELTTISRFHASSSDGWGWDSFIDLSYLNEKTGYLVKDKLIVEAEIRFLGLSKNWA